jgi:antitoxin (DNA-binding transcriptional repressor) of toxin-antitoxin stability system
MVLRPIKKGEQLCIAYRGRIFEIVPLKERQEYFMKFHGFVCQCEACKDPIKYPVFKDLYIRDPKTFCFYNQEAISKPVQEGDLDFALEHFYLICQYLEENDNNYPSKEICQFPCVLKEFIKVFCKVDDL